VRRRYIVTILTAIAVVGYLAFDDKQQGPTGNTKQAIQQEPDYIVTGLSAQHYNTEGQLDRVIKADSAHHYPLDDSTQLDNPNLALYQLGQPQWQISAQSGTLNQGQTLELNGHVQVNPRQQSAGDFSLSSPHLSIDLEQQIADTDKPVIISSPSTKLTAIGMNLDMVKQQAQFKSTVQGIHDPNAQ